MLSDEEKKAIKGLEWSQQQMRLGNLPDYDQGHYADIRIVLNLIEKQQKEIECDNLIIKRAIEIKDKQSKEIEELKEKCKKKNKTIETMQFIKAIQRGQENTLLITEEQCAIKNKYMIEVSNGEFVDANELYSIWKNSVSKDKIKAKIKEYKKQIEELKDSQIFTQTEYEGAIKFGQSLLEKE